MGELIREHPKFVDKWAKRYIKLWKQEGPDVARNWAVNFLPTGPRQRMVDRVNELQSPPKTSA